MEALVFTYSLYLARVGTFVAVLPVLGGSSVPRTVKVGLTVALATFQFSLHGLDAVNPAFLHQAAHLSWLTCGLALAREAVLGAALGCGLGLILLPVRIAGEYIGQEMGLAMGPMIDPTSVNPAAVVPQVLEALATLLLLGLNGHHLFLATLHGTFVGLPIGGPTAAPPIGDLVTGLARSQQWGLLLAAPLGAALFLTSVVLALMTRAAPQMNLFSVGFSLRVGVGLTGAFLLLPDFVRGSIHALAHFSALLRGLV